MAAWTRFAAALTVLRDFFSVDVPAGPRIDAWVDGSDEPPDLSDMSDYIAGSA
ncbi:hypothetical protein DFR70_104455 [Nocardia tenerifensis]|uniref:Uncharacterized protein n=1 Tax=Nocardia tenerifensis TaxID=228006 RepID=A0A318K287_9NOCA|nr:hypothetical protein [Nocardia tenerifensis]PXX65391.1 hypothetical protein DFR70_104455 [Nocardia tenerifensis]